MDEEKLESARKLLGLPNEASVKEIKKRFKELAKKVHPDLNQEEQEISFIKLYQAYQFLLDYADSFPLPLTGSEARKYLDRKNYMEKMKRQFIDGWWGDLK